MFTLLVTSGFTTVTNAVAAGISPSMAPSAVLLGRLRVHSTCEQEKVPRTIFIVTATLKVTAITFTRERCEWDSALETATRAIRMLTLTQAGPKCPGSSLRRCQKRSNKHVTLNQLDFPENLKKIKL